MAMNRREFAKFFAAAGAMAAIAPATLAWIAEIKAHPLDMPRPTVGDIVHVDGTYLAISQMQRVMSSVIVGREQPTLILMHKDRLNEFVSKINPRQRWSNIERDFHSICFNGGDVAVGSRVPMNEVWFINENHPRDTRFNAILKLAVA
jgi:hypothetical protein